ncbi:MAG: hypothetical protein QNJ72_15005 [Pleurocapsa sp. MO_226.B13]|nr:hypothetical protein [Pleurocapsa sp. MO_226.B13]
MLIEAYGAEGAIALSLCHSFDYLKALLSQTAEMRKSDEDREQEYQEEKLTEFIERNQHRSVELKNPDGTQRQIKLKKFAQHQKLLRRN